MTDWVRLFNTAFAEATAEEALAPITRPTWFRFVSNKMGLGTDLYLYDEIGCDGICAKDFVPELRAVKGPLNVHINSPGGDVYEGLAIYNALKQRSGGTVGFVDGVAASIASVIAMGCEKVVMGKHSTMMIHDAFGMTMGDSNQMAKMVDRLERTSADLASIYAERAGGTPDRWRNRMKAETWYTADEAVAAGLADLVA